MPTLEHKSGTAMDRKRAIQIFATALFVGLMAGIGTLSLVTGLADS